MTIMSLHPRILKITYYRESIVGFEDTGIEPAIEEQHVRLFVPKPELAKDAMAAMVLGYVQWAEKLNLNDLSELRKFAEDILNKDVV